MFLSEELLNKWKPVLDYPDLPEISDPHRRAVVATLLENQEKASREDAAGSGGYGAPTLLGEAAPTMNAGSNPAGFSSGASAPVAGFDPVLISLVRRSVPNLIAYDVCGVQPMTGPTGLIFALRPTYGTGRTKEAFYQEANTQHSALSNNGVGGVFTGLDGATTGFGADTVANLFGDPTAANYNVATGMSTARAEALGDSAANPFEEMGFSVERVSVTAVSRALKAEYTMELAQDLKQIHNLDAESELSNILSTEILAEINREVIRSINYTASFGAQENVVTSGTFDLDVDANGRWSVERFKGLIFQIERECNALAKVTRRGKGNVMICGSDVASALNMAGVLDYTPALSSNLNVDDTGNTFAGVMSGRVKVYIDPYFNSGNGNQYATVGYKGSSSFDAGLFYCPYVPLQMVRAVGENSFQPKIGFKTRYGMVANPFATTAADGVLSSSNKNIYYRLMAIANLM